MRFVPSISTFFISGSLALHATTATLSSNTEANLRTAMLTLLTSTEASDTLNFASGGGTITLTNTDLPVFTNLFSGASKTITVNGNGVTIDGASAYQAFAAIQLVTTPSSSTAINLTVNDLTFSNCKCTGGAGGNGSVGGGGGLGAGGAIFVDQFCNLTLSGVTLNSNQAIGGTGGPNSNPGAGGGGGVREWSQRRGCFNFRVFARRWRRFSIDGWV